MIIAIFTTTRAEFGALKPFIEGLQTSTRLQHRLFVGGAHLRKEFGNTIEEILAQGFSISDRFPFMNSQSSSLALAQALGDEIKEVARIFSAHEFDLVALAGDRYELLPIALAAIMFKKPILHMYGGEVTEGVIDDQIRNMLTKAAHLHFTSCELHSERVRNMGEEAHRVHTTGELVVDNMAKAKKIPRATLFGEYGLDPAKRLALMTYHPVESGQEVTPLQQLEAMFRAIEKFDIQLMVTAPNVEVGSHELLRRIKDTVAGHPNYRFCESLGIVKYHGFLAESDFVIGNSSSGLLEAPYFKIPAVNIGDRQKGRIRHESVIDVNVSPAAIEAAITKAMSPEFRAGLKNLKFKLGDGHAADKMVAILENLVIDSSFIHKKATD